MTDERTTTVWLGLALLCGAVAGLGMAGGAPVLPLFLCGLALTCALHRPSRDFVIEKACAALSANALRTALIMVGAIMLIQFLPLELALLMAGDVLAYVELLAAVSLIAANARLAPVKARVGLWLQSIRRRLTRARSGRARTVRVRRPRAAPTDDSDGMAPDWALA